MTNIEDGTWEHLRERGVWHFDPAREDPPRDHRVIARVRGDLDRLIDEVPPGTVKGLGSSMSHRSDDGLSAFDRVQAGNEADARRLGLDPDLEYALVFDAKSADLAPTLADRLVELLPLGDAYWKLHCQQPGQLWPVHFDNYHAFDREPGADVWADPGVRRLWVMLCDWQWGQVVQVGNTTWSGWTAGEVLFFDWLVPHGSANFGHAARWSLLVTGRAMPELEDWVAADGIRTLDLS